MNWTRCLLKEINTLVRHFGALMIDIEATNKYNIRSLDLVSSYNLGLWGYYDDYFFITFVFLSGSKSSVSSKKSVLRRGLYINHPS